MAPSQRLEALDSIRGLAALAVLFKHTLGVFAWPAAYVSWCSWPGLNLAVDSQTAVTMFFVLSGFVLVRPYLAASRTMFIPAFYVKRIARIWLPWFFVFVASLAARHWLMPAYETRPPISGWLLGFWHQPLSVADIFKQCGFLLYDFSRTLLPQDWSLGVELRASALIPIFLIMARWRQGWLWLGLLALGIFIGKHTGGYYVAFIVGVLLARHYACLVEELKAMPFSGRLLVLLAGICGYESRWAAQRLHFESLFADQVVWVISSFGCAAIILAALSSRRISHWLTRRPLLFIGQISYSVYLLQFIVLICFLPAGCFYLNQCGMSLPGLFIVSLSASVILTLAFSWVTYQAVEKPSTQLGRWLANKLENGWRKPAEK